MSPIRQCNGRIPAFFVFAKETVQSFALHTDCGNPFALGALANRDCRVVLHGPCLCHAPPCTNSSQRRVWGMMLHKMT